MHSSITAEASDTITATAQAPRASAPKRRTAKTVLGGIGMALLRLVYFIPVFGWMVREAVEGSLEAKAYFVLSMFLTAVALVITFGYPALITIALAGVAMGMTVVIATTLE